MTTCPLCSSPRIRHYHRDRLREYLQCEDCLLVSVPREFHLTPEAEKAEYDKHRNSPDDEGYRRFLSRTTVPLFERLPDGSVGLDFGCGPGPAISQMAAEAGFSMSDFDPYYFDDRELLSRQYDFVTMTEVIEHVARADRLLGTLDKLLKPGAILAIMTKRVIDREAFARWHYKNDPTHICFYSEETFAWIGRKMGWNLQVIDNDVVFFVRLRRVLKNTPP